MDHRRSARGLAARSRTARRVPIAPSMCRRATREGRRRWRAW